MKRSTKIFIVILVVFLVLCCIDFRPWFYEFERKYINPVDETRKSYNVGSCKNMQKDLYYFIIYLNDNESKWNENDKAVFTEKKFIPSMQFLSQEAITYNISLVTEFKTHPHNDTQVNYDGIIEAEAVKNGSQSDIFSQVAESMGYDSPKEMNESLQKELNVKQLAYLIVLNKEGRSYKYAHVESNRERYEFCVFFSKSIGYTDETCYSTIAHEILHLFGAEDFYDPYGDFPEREKLAMELYPDDIMFGTVEDINTVKIGEYTAYSVGWIDELPPECNTPLWWE